MDGSVLFTQKIIIFLLFSLFLKSGSCSAAGPKETDLTAQSYDYDFDPELFRGGNISVSALRKLAKKENLQPGIYNADIYVNGHYIERNDVNFLEKETGEVLPCFTVEFLTQAGIYDSKRKYGESETVNSCYFLSQVARGGNAIFDLNRLRIDLTIPQGLLKFVPRDYVNPADLSSGDNVAFINYLSNYYHVSYRDNTAQNQDAVWLSLNGGVNLGSWQYRQLSNLNWDDRTGSRWNRIRSYIQRPLPAIGSQFSAGELITGGRFFTGMNYDGIYLSSDERMLPNSQRGYAPIVRGVATSNAKVTVSQNGAEIYQISVAPGAFEINDLYPTSYSGDLNVEVKEADGTVSRFSVPFSAVPESIRPGLSRYSFSSGKTRGAGDDSLFSDFIWQEGLTNAITGNAGLRFAQSYQSALVGSVYTSPLGAVGMDINYSRARLPETGYINGWMARLSYSKTFQPSNTSISLATYRYSSKAYRELGDVLGVRQAEAQDTLWSSGTSQQLSRFDLSLSQSLSRYGDLFVSATTQSYRHHQGHDTQLQMGYSGNVFNDINYNFSLARQRVAGNGYAAYKETVTSLSVSIPLNIAGRSTTLSNAYTQSSNGGYQYQTSASGAIDSDNSVNYNVSAQHARHSESTVLAGSLQTRMSDMSAGLSASQGKNYWQASGNMQGALAVHSGGITFGPYLGETFALVEAKGATGAKVYNSQQVTIDNRGYALVPALTPYQYSKITLDPQGMENDTELIDNEMRIAPVAGAAVKIVFKTRTGIPLLINSKTDSGEVLPTGADVYDEKGNRVGVVGQRGQIYIRIENSKGTVTIKWGESAAEQCYLPYDISARNPENVLVKISGTCLQ